MRLKIFSNTKIIRIQKLVKDLNKSLLTTDKGPWSQNKITNLDRTSGEIIKIIDRNSIDQCIFRQFDGLNTCVSLLELISKTNDLTIPTKSASNVANLLSAACRNNFDNCFYLISTNKFACLLEVLSHELNIMIPDNFDRTKLCQNACVTSLIQLASLIFLCLVDESKDILKQNDNIVQEKQANLFSRATDIISFIVSLGILDKISVYFCNIRGPVTEDQHTGEMLTNCLSLLTSITKFLSSK